MRRAANGYLLEVGLRGIRGKALATGAALLLGAGLAAAIVEVVHREPRTRTSVAETTTRVDTRPAVRGRKELRVTTARAFAEAVEHARAGETIRVMGDVRIPGEFKGFDRVVEGGTVDVVLGAGVRFTGGAGSGFPAVFVRDSGGWRIRGGTISNPGGAGILVYTMPGPFRWSGFRIHDTAGDCVAVLPVGGNIDRLALQGLTGSASPDLELDPHSEKGTGIHAWNIADAEGGIVENSSFVANVVGQATGAAVQIDTSHIAHVTVSARANHVGFAIPGTSWHGYARRQVAGNVVQLWGGTPPGPLDLPFVEGGDIQGRLLDTSGVSEGANLSDVHVGVVRATGPILQSPLLSGPPVQFADGMRRRPS